MTKLIQLALCMCIGFAVSINGSSAIAQSSSGGLFSSAITVNDRIITRYEIEQRIALLRLLRAPGDPEEEAEKGLIEDRLRIDAAAALGVEVTEEAVLVGMEEFANRANLNREQFLAAIGREGIAAETFRDFVSAGIAWREVVRARFGPRAQVTDAEIDRALSLEGSQNAVRVLLAEIILPAEQPNAESLLNELASTISTPGAFSAAARRYSASPSAGRGGRLEWLPLNRVPGPIRAAVLPLEPGETTAPITLGNGIAIFQLRGLEEGESVEQEAQSVEYVTILIPGDGQSTAAKYDAEYDTCEDLYKPAQSLPADYFERVVLASQDVPADIAAEIMKLDDNESSAALTRQDGAFTLYLKLCGRTFFVEEEPKPETASEEVAEGEEAEVVPDRRAEIREQLFQQRLASYANSFLEELRADAYIVKQ